MRACLVIVGLVALARAASAEPEQRCFAGARVDTIDRTELRESVVVRRVIDRAAKTIQQTTWAERDPERALTRTMAVDPDRGTFTTDTKHAHETGTLEGKPWQWTVARGKTSAPELGMEFQSETRLVAEELVETSSVQRDGKTVMTSRLEAKAFDCKQLDAKRAALDHTSPQAVHRCYEGTSTAGEGKRQVVIDQVVDPDARTIELRRWTQGSDAIRRFVLAIDGDKIAVTASGITGTGSLAGKPGAWTAYTWSGRFEILEVGGRGTLGGPELTDHFVTRRDGKDASHTDITAAAFDCARLGERRAALAAMKPVPASP